MFLVILLAFTFFPDNECFTINNLKQRLERDRFLRNAEDFGANGRQRRSDGSYMKERNKFLQEEGQYMLGATLVLNENEKIVNKTLMEAKAKELEWGFQNPGLFPPARHFIEAKPWIEQSEVFTIIKKMPKGGALHIHDVSAVSHEYIMDHIITRENLYVCFKNGEEGDPTFLFSKFQPEDKCFKPVEYYRNKYGDNFNEFFLHKLTLYPITDVCTTVEEAYPDVDAVWQKFQSLFTSLSPLLKFKPVFGDLYRQCLQEFYDDNVQYIETRSSLSWLYDWDGTVSNNSVTAEIIQQVVEKFKREHPGFNLKVIYAVGRNVDTSTMDDYLDRYISLHNKFPNLLVGFDMVNQEDRGKLLIDFIEKLKQKAPSTKFFFHAGETNWYGMPVDMNLIDAILLNTTRIGHGYALTKHPKVMEKVLERQIGIEVNPISNQVLNLVKDLRNHPASALFARGFPVVVSSDDPGLWGAKGLSYDFYEAFMGMASAAADLRTLKQLALNSLLFSGLNPQDKADAIKHWTKKWDQFIDDMVNEYM